MNPGSDAAILAGCTCPIFDNNHGRFPPMTDRGQACWWFTEGCPIHDVPPSDGDPEGAPERAD